MNKPDASGARATLIAVGPALIHLAMLMGSWWPAAALAEALPGVAGLSDWRIAGLAPPLTLWIAWRGTDAPKARRPRAWMYVVQRGAVVSHFLFLAGGFLALALGATPEVPWTWSVYSALGAGGGATEWRRAGRGLRRGSDHTPPDLVP